MDGVDGDLRGSPVSPRALFPSSFP